MSLRLLVALLGLLFAPALVFAQPRPVAVVMLSDIHFDPFRAPSRFAQLQAAPVERWPAILNAAPAADDPARFEALHSACGAPAPDTDWQLMERSLAAAHDAQPHPLFVTLSGDLLAHSFPCSFHQLAPAAGPGDLAAFSAKTVSFVLAELQQRFPGVPVFATLGNNDSGCGDYREDAGDPFLQTAATALRAATLDQRLAISATGDYNAMLPPPMNHTRLIVLNDLFQSHLFGRCPGAATTPAVPSAREQLDWLRTQLADARAKGDRVWFMAHIPPGVDAATSFRRYVLAPTALCNAAPQPFLATPGLADALLDFADVVRLAIFGHTHMDEVRLLTRPADDVSKPVVAQPSGGGTVRSASESAVDTAVAIPVKLVPSISPFLGNHPAFLVAYADPQTAVLLDWQTFVSPGPAGSPAPWTEAYRFTTIYHLPDFSAASAAALSTGFLADKTGQAPASVSYRAHFYPGDIGLFALGLAQVWPAYACTVREYSPARVHACICAALPAPQPGKP